MGQYEHPHEVDDVLDSLESVLEETGVEQDSKDTKHTEPGHRNKTYDNNDSNVSDTKPIFSDHNSDSGDDKNIQEDSNEEEKAEQDINSSNNYFYGKNKFHWSKTPIVSSHSRTPKHNIIVKLRGLRPPLRNKSTIKEKEA
ncbi:hypothetical protein FQA39_LY08338 [Lamprigera yunnana]|nr:hypothetical protein FQA39_LY08338 [Lamprigera yunnana]